MAAKKVKEPISMEEDMKASDLSLAELSAILSRRARIQSESDTLAGKLETAQAALKTIDEFEIPVFFTEAGISEVTLPDGTKVTVKEKIYPHIKKEVFDVVYVWLQEHELDSIVKREVKVSFSRGAEEAERAQQLLLLLAEESYEFDSKLSINSQTLGAFVRERLEGGLELPLEIDINPLRVAVIKSPK